MLQYGLYVSSSHSYTKKLRQKLFLWWHERKITDTVNSLDYYLCMVGGIGKVHWDKKQLVKFVVNLTMVLIK